MPFTDRELLARMLLCEAGGEGENGMKAVASVIMNRVNVADGEYFRISQGGSIRNVLLQEGQFDCSRTEIRNKYNSQNIYNLAPEEIHFQIADWAIAGNRIPEVGTCLWYMNPFMSNCPNAFPYNGSGTLHTRIIQHCFYRPTTQYGKT